MIYKEDIEEYIDREIEYIKQDLEASGFDKDLAHDLEFLSSLDSADKDTILQQVNDDEELSELIRDLMKYYVYHYKRNEE